MFKMMTVSRLMGVTVCVGLALAIGAGLLVYGKAGSSEEKTNPATQSTQGRDATAAPSRKPTIVELGSKSCQSCREMKQVLSALSRDYGDRLNVVEIDVLTAEGRPHISQYRLQMIPTQVFLDGDGIEIGRHVGTLGGEEILAFLKVAPGAASWARTP